MAVPSRCRAALPHLSAFDQSQIDELIRDALTDLSQKAPQIEAGLGEALCDDDDENPPLTGEKSEAVNEDDFFTPEQLAAMVR